MLMASVSRVDVMHFLNANGRSSIGQILESTHLKPATARKALGELEQLGFITADIPVGERSGFVVHYEPNTKEITVALMAFTSWFISRND